MRVSTRYLINYPSADRSDSSDVPRDIESVVNAVETSVMFGQGTLASRPAFGTTGRLYMATDLTPKTLYYDDGASWTATGSLPHAATHKVGGTDEFNDVGANLASGAALAVTNAKHLITGSTTITSIAPTFTSAKGQQLTLVFQATITVRNLNNIKLFGGIDAGFVANEILKLFYDGANWVEETRTSRYLSGQGGIIWNGSSTPTGLVAEDGSAISRATYAAFFNNVGTLYGVGDGSTTVNLPDSRGRVDVAYVSSGGHTDVATIALTEGTTLASRRPKHPTSHALTVTGAPAVGSLALPDHAHLPGGMYLEGSLDGATSGANRVVTNDHAVTTTAPVLGNTGSPTSFPGIGGAPALGSLAIGGTAGVAGSASDTPAYLVRPKFTRI